MARPAIPTAMLAVVLLTSCAPATSTSAVTPSLTPGATPPVTTSEVTTSEPSAPVLAPPPPPPCAPSVRACVSLSQRQAWLLSAGVVDYGPVPISHGGTANPTPTGTFPVSWKDADNTSSIYGTPMPHSVFFAPGGIAFHEGSVTEDSHGCVRLTAEAARTFFDNLNRGQLVQVVG